MVYVKYGNSWSKSGEATDEMLDDLYNFAMLKGSENRPSMLEKGMYDSWKTRIILYIRGKENGEMLKDSIDNSPYQLKPEITVNDTDDVTDI
ncbi:hypothetical protein Tco_0749923 [Tanacetum coccineum]|uniref:Uncharacterized protein n=1 Tax=Tanacetum coccineum TaxID=301880 RepID=A0ABQ4Z2V8_9ASTR